jgi:hypothetical protein
MFKQEIIYTVNTGDLRISKKLQQSLQQWQTQFLAQLQQEPGTVKRPVRWTPAAIQNKPPNTRWGYYSKQKAAFFASNGFGRGIPTKRSHALSQAWQAIVNVEQITRFQVFTNSLIAFLAQFKITEAPTPPPPTIIVDVSNPVSYERYVEGENQQGFHKDTGWLYAPDVINTGFQQAEVLMSEGFME